MAEQLLYAAEISTKSNYLLWHEPLALSRPWRLSSKFSWRKRVRCRAFERVELLRTPLVRSPWEVRNRRLPIAIVWDVEIQSPWWHIAPASPPSAPRRSAPPTKTTTTKIKTPSVSSKESVHLDKYPDGNLWIMSRIQRKNLSIMVMLKQRALVLAMHYDLFV